MPFCGLLQLYFFWLLKEKCPLFLSCLLTTEGAWACFSTSPYSQRGSVVFFFSTCGWVSLSVCVWVCVQRQSHILHHHSSQFNSVQCVTPCLCVCVAIRACRCINHWSRLRLFYYSWCRPFIASDIYLSAISHDLQEKEGGKEEEKERGREKLCVWRGWEALAKLYINTFVRWAGVVEYLCVHVCFVSVTFDSPTMRTRNLTPQSYIARFPLVPFSQSLLSLFLLL